MKLLKSRFDLLAAAVLLSASLTAADGWARGFGGFHGGGFGGYRGGGFSRGGFADEGFGGGGFDRGGFNRDSFGGGGFQRDGFGGDFDRAGVGAGGFERSGFGSGFDRDSMGGGAFDRGAFGGGYAHSPSRDQLNSFLGMPSGDGFRTAGANSSGRVDLGNGSGTFNVQHDAVEGPRGGVAAGASVEGPRGGEAARGVAVGPNGRVAAGSVARGPNGGVAARGVAAGPHGVAAGYARVSPAGRYTTATAVRGNFNNYGIYGAGWYGAHPGAWFATGWAAGAAWNAATWSALGGWFGYGLGGPVYNYNYGSNIVYENGNVYVGNQDAGTSAEYYDQAAALADAGNQADPASADWLPLGVFALAPAGQKQSNIVVQLAVDKQGLVRGNYTDTFSGQPVTIHGAVDKGTQRVAWTVGENKSDVFETGLYNLTKPEAPVLVHFGNQRTEQWLLVRLKQPVPTSQDAGGQGQTAPQAAAE